MQLEFSPQELVVLVQELSRPIFTHFQQPIEWGTKADGTLVSEDVDIKINNDFCDWCAKRDDIGFVGEEGAGADPGQYKHILALDPMDGTRAYKNGNKTCSTVATIMECGGDGLWRPIKTAIFAPVVNFLVAAERGSGTLIEKDGVKKSGQVRGPNQDGYDIYVSAWRGVPFHLMRAKQEIYAREQFSERRFGGIAAFGARIAAGRVDACVFGGKSAIETAGMQLAVEEAGGYVCDLFGNKLDGYELVVKDDGVFDFALPKGAIIASNQQVAEQLSSVVRSHN